MRTKILPGLILLALIVLASGCAAPPPAPTATPSPQAPSPTNTAPTLPTVPAGPVMLQFIGHDCTLIVAPDGTRIISDPYKDHPSGLAAFPEGLTADVVTVSHYHPDHANVGAIKGVNGKPKFVLEPGTTQAGMVKITGYKGDHGLVNGKSSGDNTVFVFEIGNVKIVHLGAAGVVTQSDILAAMENADVVVMDAMGDEAHPLKDELDQLVGLKVRTIIPTHYTIEDNPSYYGSVPLAEFLQVVPATLAVVKQGSKLEVTSGMPEQVVVLAPAANETP